MMNNLRVCNLIVSGKLPIKKDKITQKQVDELIFKCGWFLPREDNIMFSKQYNYRKKGILNVHKKQKNPYVTVWFSGSIVIVGLKSRKEGNDIYDLVIKDFKKIGVKLK